MWFFPDLKRPWQKRILKSAFLASLPWMANEEWASALPGEPRLKRLVTKRIKRPLPSNTGYRPVVGKEFLYPVFLQPTFDNYGAQYPDYLAFHSRHPDRVYRMDRHARGSLSRTARVLCQ